MGRSIVGNALVASIENIILTVLKGLGTVLR